MVTLIMGDKLIGQFIMDINKWKNIQYDFSGHSNNCTWNVQVHNIVIDYEIKLNCN